MNIGILVGNSALRIGAVGWGDRAATAREIADRCAPRFARRWRPAPSASPSGLDYPPGSFASTEELAELTNEAARRGGIYHTHVRYPLGDRFLDPFREAIEIGRRGEGPSHITHFYHRATYPGPPERLLALVDEARAEGLDVTFDMYPYEWASTRLLIQLPTLGPGRRSACPQGAPRRCRASATASARSCARAAPPMPSTEGWADVRLGAFTDPANQRWEARTVADVMRDTRPRRRRRALRPAAGGAPAASCR